ncbi:S23 ribosomal protein [Rhodopirellula baltica SWK14]|uniref:S23 ribosomal protein n=2 Tax=Pirellulaceae TaxID=2691357 RepID=L7CF78_RHOBT|nr:S23 ribosomal protein [Rhodopirellula baltica SWK14]
MAFGSLREAEYQLTIADRLGYTDPDESKRLAGVADEAARVLAGLIKSLRKS